MAFHEHHLEAFIAVIRRWTPESLNLGGILHVALVQVSALFGTKLEKVGIVVVASDHGKQGVAGDGWDVFFLFFFASFMD